MRTEISKDRFTELFVEPLGDNFFRADTLFDDYGELLAYDVTNVLLHAVGQGKTPEVLSELERHWEECLKDQHPNFRGRSEKTRIFFTNLCENVLQLEPQ